MSFWRIWQLWCSSDTGDSGDLGDTGRSGEYGDSSESGESGNSVCVRHCSNLFSFYFSDKIYQIGVLLLKNFHFSLSFFKNGVKRSKNPILHVASKKLSLFIVLFQKRSKTE